MLIKEKINFKGIDTFLKFSLNTDINLVDYQQEIDNLTEETKEELINPVIDYEVRKFTYKTGIGSTELSFFLTNALTNSFTIFSSTEISSVSNKILNSFFILDFYDNFNYNIQNKIFTSYLTQILGGEIDGAGIPIPKYKIYNDTKNQFYYWYISKSYLDLYSGNTEITGYTKFSFYNAKDGKISLFYNKDNQSLSTPEKMYFKTILNLNTMEWEFTSTIADAYELSSQNAYVNKINDRVSKFDNEKQNYPTGNTFQNITGTYEIE